MKPQRFLKDNAKLIFVLMGVAIGSLGLALVYEVYRSYAYNPARNHADFAAAEEIYFKERQELEKRMEPLRNSLGDQMASNPEILKIFENMKADHTESLAAFRSVFENNPKKPQGFAAGLKSVAILIEQDKSDDALPVLEKLLSNPCLDPLTCDQLRVSKASILATSGQKEEALQLLETALANTQGTLEGEILASLLLKKAEIASESGEKDSAIQTAQKILEEHKGTPAAKKARALIALLEMP